VRLASILSIGALVLLAACSSNSPSTSGSSSPSISCVDLRSQNPATIVLQNIAFNPKCVTVTGTQTITLENKDSVIHNWTITGTSVNVNIPAGQTMTVNLDIPAGSTHAFFCRFHQAQGMVGQILVK
jgi:plastocyanin